MTMGERIRQARIEAGLSQRQLAGEEITRNMLSALEHDGANPSVGTLQYLSDKLCKPISYFFGEEPPKIPQMEEMTQARAAFSAGKYRKCLQWLEQLSSEEFDLERRLLQVLSAMELAEQALREKRFPYANELLRQAERAGEGHPYFSAALQNRWLVLSAQAAQRPAQRRVLIDRISDMDTLLCLKAQAALEDGNVTRSEKLLEAAQNRTDVQWNWLRGEVHFAKKEYAKAVECYRRAEEEMPRQTGKRLEICYRELEDYKMAYYYATKTIKQ